MEFDFKITTWERVTVDPEKEEDVLQAIIDGKITTSTEIYNFLADQGDMNVDIQKLYDTDEQMSLNDNEGFSTIEVYDNGECIWADGVW